MENKKEFFLQFLLVGSISMLFGEVAAGSSNLWFINPFLIVITFVLYASHVLFYFNIAYRFKRTSLPQLYLMGMLFGLYEAPITQVIWSGYIGEGKTLWGSFMGVAWAEFITLVFFWHPVMSFIIPILIFELFLVDYNDSTDVVIQSHIPTLKMVKRKKKLFIILFFILGIFQLNGTGYNVFIAVPAILGTMLIITVILRWIKGNLSLSDEWSIETLVFKKKGMILLTLLLILHIYGLGTILLTYVAPNRWPTEIIGYITVILFAIIVLILFRLTPTNHEMNIPNIQGVEELISKKELYVFFAVWITGTTLFAFIPVITFGIAMFMYLGTIILGPITLYKFLRWFINNNKL